MATYKKGYKKQSAETVLLKIIIGVIIGVFTFVAIAFIYDAATKWKGYDHYTAITEYDGVFEYANGGDEALQDYVVYFYSETCSNCTAIKTDALRIGNKLNKDSEMFFIADTANMVDEDTNLNAFLDSIGENTTVTPTPMLLVVADGEFYDVYLGSNDVINILESIEDGTFAGFND